MKVAIPRVFHFVWTGDPMPDHLQNYVASWQDIHPEWDIRVWGAADLDWLENQDVFDRADDLTGSPGQLRSDVARYEILRRHGGVYVDCDFEARKPIDGLCNVPAWAAWEDRRWVNNAILGSVPGHPLWSVLIGALPASVAANRGKRPNVMTGPQFITRHIRRRSDVTVHPAEWFYPYLWSELHRIDEEFPDAYAVHHWDNARKRKGLACA